MTARRSLVNSCILRFKWIVNSFSFTQDLALELGCGIGKVKTEFHSQTLMLRGGYGFCGVSISLRDNALIASA